MTELHPPATEASPKPPEARRALPNRRRRRWLIGILVGVVVLALGAAGAVAAYVYSIDRSVTQNIKRTEALPSETPTEAGQSPRPTKHPRATGALNFVLLGSDNRDPGDDLEGRSDSIMVVHLNTDRNQAYITSFPRDMWVTIPGHGKNKINAAFALGGQPLMVQTLENLLDVRMDHVVLIDFEGFIEMTETLGGVTVNNSHAFSSHGYDYPKGEITIEGKEALWFVRERKSLPNGDLDRAANQRKVIKAILQKALSAEVVADPGKLTNFIGGIAQHVTVDQSLSDDEIRSIALSMRLRSSGIKLLQAPISGFDTSPDGQSIDVVDTAKTKQLAKAMREDTMDNYLQKNPEG